MNNSYLKSMGCIFLKIIALMNAFATLWLFSILLLMTSDVICRTVFNHPIKGASELVRISIVCVVFLQMSHTLWVNRHIRSEIILDRLRKGVRYILESIMNLVGAAVFICFFVSSWKPMLLAWEILEFEGEGALRVPVYPVRTIIVIGSFFTGAVFLYKAVAGIMKARKSAQS